MKRRQQTDAIQYTLRNVPLAVDRILRRRAAEQAKSLNEVALEALAGGAGAEHQVVQHHDLDFLFGSWVKDKAVEESLKGGRKVDASLWR